MNISEKMRDDGGKKRNKTIVIFPLSVPVPATIPACIRNMEVSQPGATASSSPPVITLKIIYHRQKIFRVTFYSGTYQSGYVDKYQLKCYVKCPKIRDFGATQFWLCTDISDHWDPRLAIVATFLLSPEPDESCVHLDTEQSRCAPNQQLLRKYFYSQSK